jgi:hypothetical protein
VKIPISFDHELIVREIETWHMRSAVISKSLEMGDRYEIDNKSWCALTAEISIIMMDCIMQHGGTADDAIRDALK